MMAKQKKQDMHPQTKMAWIG